MTWGILSFKFTVIKLALSSAAMRMNKFVVLEAIHLALTLSALEPSSCRLKHNLTSGSRCV